MIAEHPPAKRILDGFRADPMNFYRYMYDLAEKRMADFQVTYFSTLAPSIVAVVRDKPPPIPRSLYCASKGCAKTSDSALMLVHTLAFSPFAIPMQSAAGDTEQAMETVKVIEDWLRLAPWLEPVVNIGRRLISNPDTGSEIAVLSSDSSTSHGARPKLLFIDELTHIQDFTFVETLLDNAAKLGDRNLTMVACNAGFQGSPAWKLREIARTTPERWFFHSVEHPAPWVTEAELKESERRNSRERHLRMFYSKWSSGIGDYLDVDDLEAAVRPDLLPAFKLPENTSAVIGVDLAYRNDRAAAVCLGANHATRRIQLLDVRSWAPTNGKDIDLVAAGEEILEMSRRFQAPVRFDPAQAIVLMQILQRAHVTTIEVAFSGKNLDEMASMLLITSRARILDLYPHPQLIRDLKRLNIQEKSYGHRLTATRDADGHADIGTAFAIALPAAVELAGSNNGPGMSIQLDFDATKGTEQFSPGYFNGGRPGPVYDDGPGWGVNNFW